jgi:hypothetical protein
VVDPSVGGWAGDFLLAGVVKSGGFGPSVGLGERFAPSRECPHLRIEIWGTRFHVLLFKKSDIAVLSWFSRDSQLDFAPRLDSFERLTIRSNSGGGALSSHR